MLYGDRGSPHLDFNSTGLIQTSTTLAYNHSLSFIHTTTISTVNDLGLKSRQPLFVFEYTASIQAFEERQSMHLWQEL